MQHPCNKHRTLAVNDGQTWSTETAPDQRICRIAPGQRSGSIDLKSGRSPDRRRFRPLGKPLVNQGFPCFSAKASERPKVHVARLSRARAGDGPFAAGARRISGSSLFDGSLWTNTLEASRFALNSTTSSARPQPKSGARIRSSRARCAERRSGCSGAPALGASVQIALALERMATCRTRRRVKARFRCPTGVRSARSDALSGARGTKATLALEWREASSTPCRGRVHDRAPRPGG